MAGAAPLIDTIGAGSAGAPRALVVGHDGMLGRAWRELLTSRGIPFVAPGLEELDLTRPGTLAQIGGKAISLVINCAAWTDVDGAEADEDKALAVNGVGVGNLARACKQADVTLVHYSTDYIFAGDAHEPYAVDAPTAPAGAYGRTKLAGENEIKAIAPDALVIRTSWLYAPWGKNFLRTIASLAQARDSLRVVSDQRGRPTSAQHLALASLQLLEHDARGTYHICDGGECSWHDFAAHIVETTGAACRVDPCTTAEFPRPAPRPAYSVLDLSKTERILGPMPHWKENVTKAVLAMEPMNT